MVNLIIVCSVTNQDIYDLGTKPTLERLGVDYKLILTNPNLMLSESYNSILETNLEDVKQSKYIIFMAQDINILDEGWGKKLVEVCDSLPHFGYGGVECRCGSKEIGYFKQGRNNDPPIEVTCCDGCFFITPSKLFLERQFDTSFPWYPFVEDYVLWLSCIKNLKIYHVPIKEYTSAPSYPSPSKWVSQFKSDTEYATQLRKDHERLLKKWGIKELITTTWG